MIEIIRIDYKVDIDEIIKLIQGGLDKSYSKSFFIWKHLENPFGKSYGLIARDLDKIIGLRMFMYWEFYCPKQNKRIRAIRPVDTVINEDYRGQGLFKKLTLKGLEDCEKQYDLIFNTPNNNSLPGYLKMGWKRFENNTEFQIGVVNPFKKIIPYGLINANEIIIDEGNFHSEYYTSEKSKRFLEWRYSDKSYKIASYEFPGHYVIYKKSKIKGLPILFIYELIGKTENYECMLNSLGRGNSTPFTYMHFNKNQIKEFVMTFKRSQSVIVIKDANGVKTDLFNFSLGDIESKL